MGILNGEKKKKLADSVVSFMKLLNHSTRVARLTIESLVHSRPFLQLAPISEFKIHQVHSESKYEH
jgi:hypothetical protein